MKKNVQYIQVLLGYFKYYVSYLNYVQVGTTQMLYNDIYLSAVAILIVHSLACQSTLVKIENCDNFIFPLQSTILKRGASYELGI